MPLPNERIYTIEDIYALPEGERAELIDGQMYLMTPPSYKHQKLVSEFTQTIGRYIKENGGPCEVLPAPFAVFISGNDKNYVEPDISVICQRNKLSERGCEGAPDWIIEVVSPATQKRDYGIKLFKYRTAGVREYWIVNPSKEIVNVYCFEQEENSDLYSFTDEIPISIYPGFSIKVQSLLK